MKTLSSLAVALAIAFGGTADAAMLLKISAGGTDLSNLTVGDTVTFDVYLEGLGGNQLLTLIGEIPIPAEFSGPTNQVKGVEGVVADGIVPRAADLTLGPDNTNLVRGEFQQGVGGGAISSDGLFFSFDLTAQAAGSGTISFDTSSLEAEDGGPEPIVYPALSTNTLSFTTAIPEPSVVSGVALLGLLGAGAGLRRQLGKSC